MRERRQHQRGRQENSARRLRARQQRTSVPYASGTVIPGSGGSATHVPVVLNAFLSFIF